jgi:hypothetical protein
MEYNLQKTIECNLRMFPQSTYPRLSAYPSNNFVQPGLGNISKLDSFYVPLHSHSFKHEIKKNSEKTSESEQLGGGENEELLDASSISDSDEESIVQKLNERKRKMLGVGVFDSFMHPKPFKTKKIVLKKNSESKKFKTEKIGNGSKVQEQKSTNHKFQFY